MKKETKQDLKDLGIRIAPMLLLVLVMGLSFTFIYKSQIDHKSSHHATMELFSRCVSDGRMYWDSGEQRCYEKEDIDKECMLLRRWGHTEIITLPDYINKSGIVINISECNTTLIKGKFLCNGVTFMAWSILEDMPYKNCISGFTIGMHSNYGYNDVRHLGKYENASEYYGMVVLPFDEEGCEIAYYRVYNHNNSEEIEMCWK